MTTPATLSPRPAGPLTGLKSAPRPTVGFLAELRDHLATFCATLRTRRDYSGLLQGEIALDITADATAQEGRAGRLAYTAEQADLEAARLLDGVLADGRVTPREIHTLRTARRHVHRSATADHRITEVLA